MITISDVFLRSGGTLSGKSLEEVRRLPRMQRVESELQQRGGSKRWLAFLRSEARRWPELLQVDLMAIIAGAWNRHQDLQKYADRSRYAPGETIQVALTEHSIRSQHHPHIDILIDNVKQGELRFDVDLTLKVKGLMLRIRDGRIRSMQLAECQAGGEVKLEGFRIARQKTRAIAIEPEIDFGKGIPIGHQHPASLPGSADTSRS